MPNMDDFRDVYLNTCQYSCHAIKDNLEGDNCRERFCPTYIKYLLDSDYNGPESRILVSTNDREVTQFCAGWMLELVKEFGWQHRIHLQLKQCRCAASNTCQL